MNTQVHSGSATNRGVLIQARRELAARVEPLQAERATALAACVNGAIGWQPCQLPTETVQRRHAIAQTAARLVEIDAAIARAQAEVDAADEIITNFNSALEA